MRSLVGKTVQKGRNVFVDNNFVKLIWFIAGLSIFCEILDVLSMARS